MKDTELFGTKLPPISPEFFDTLNKTFREYPIDPTKSIEEIMYQAGQRSVIDWCKRSVVGGTTVSTEPKSFFQRLLHKHGAPE